MKISIIGSGYVGLVTGGCLAELGHEVLCADNNEEKIETLKQGRMPIYEPGLDELVRTHVAEGRMRFSTDTVEATRHGEIIFICVATPPKENGEADLSAIETVSRDIALAMTEYRLVVEKSTVPVQTGEWVQRTIQQYVRPDVEFDVASNPEFLREGTALKDFLHPDRVVIGTDSERAASLLVKLYQPLNAPLLLTDIKSAELIKHSANAFLAMKISFINAVSQICERAGADVSRVAMGIGLDRRIGLDFLNAGIGWGGSCFPKDLQAYISIAEKLGYDFNLLRCVEAINTNQRRAVIDKLEKALGRLDGAPVALFGLAFKPNTDDLRNAPSLEIIERLRSCGARLRVHDPVAMEKARALVPQDVTFCETPYEAASGVDAVVIVTEWAQYRNLELLKLRSLMRRPLIIDGRNIYDPSRLRALNFEYYGMGR